MGSVSKIRNSKLNRPRKASLERPGICFQVQGRLEVRKGGKPASVEDKGASLLESSTGREITAAGWFHAVVQL